MLEIRWEEHILRKLNWKRPIQDVHLQFLGLILPSLVSCLLLISIPITHIRSHSNGHGTKGCFKKAWHFPPDNPRWHVDHRTLRPTWLSSTSSSFRWCLRYDPPVQVHVQISFFLWLVLVFQRLKELPLLELQPACSWK